MAQHYLRQYGIASTVNFELFEVDGVDLRVDAAHASGDSKIMKDEGAEANTGSGFVDEGQGYSLALTATELTAARVVIYLVDSATKVWLDHTLVIETYGHPLAQHPGDPKILLSTTIDVYTSNTDFTLIAGSADDNAYGPAMMVIGDQTTVTQIAVTILGTYTGATKRAQPINDPGTFTYANGDTVTLIAVTPALPAALVDAANGLVKSDAGGLDIDQIKTDTAATLVDTAEIGVAGAGLTDLGGMSTGMKAEVNVEVKDVTDTDTSGEPGQGAPGVALSMRAKLDWLFKAFRNKKDQDANVWQLYDDAEGTVDQKATVSSTGGVTTKNEIKSGP